MNKIKTFFKSGITLVVSLLFFVNVGIARSPLGFWLGTLHLNDSTALAFRFKIEGKDTLSISFNNGNEFIKTTDVRIEKDSLFIKMPVFDSEFKIQLYDTNFDNGFVFYQMKGVWINHARKDKNIIPFSATHVNEYLWPVYKINEHSPKGKWESTFSPSSKDRSKAVGLFKGDGEIISGTFLTETGDYRYLTGASGTDGGFNLSCFDGSHAFLFTGEVKGDSIVNGHFYSGAHHHEPWVAVRNDNFQLRNPDSLTYLKPGFTSIDFSFKNLEGKSVSIKDEKFKNKVVIIQIMGTWCPNCMDETKFLAPFYDTYNSKGLEVVALAFERTDDFNKAVNNIQRSKKRFSANYEFLITMKTGKDQASEALPMLNAVMAFPTTIYIDKKGVVRKIYTGFNGPATGDAHTKFVEDTTRFVEMLLAE